VARDPNGRINTEQRGHLLLIGIDRPEKRNAFTPKIFSELAAAYSLLENKCRRAVWRALCGRRPFYRRCGFAESRPSASRGRPIGSSWRG
jgi:hypothetical protein